MEQNNTDEEDLTAEESIHMLVKKLDEQRTAQAEEISHHPEPIDYDWITERLLTAKINAKDQMQDEETLADEAYWEGLHDAYASLLDHVIEEHTGDSR
jgi:hypothetical protein